MATDQFVDDIPAHLRAGLTEAWKVGGMYAFCHLHALWEWAIRARDYKLAASVDFLHDVLAKEVETEERSRSITCLVA